MAYATVHTVTLTDDGNKANQLKCVINFSLTGSILVKLVSSVIHRVPALHFLDVDLLFLRLASSFCAPESSRISKVSINL